MKDFLISSKFNAVIIILVFVSLSALFCTARSDTDTYKQTESSQKVDSVFERHFLVLDNCLKGNDVFIDTVNQAIDFFESLTKIQSSAAYTLYGRFQVTESEVRSWREWYKDNANKLKWDEEKQKVILAPTKSSLKNKEDIETLIQKAIDYDGLQLYLHPEVAGRETLSITGASIPGDLKLYKFGRPVRIVSPESQTENCLIFNEIEIGSDKAHLSFEYNIEGVRCDLVFELRESAWSIIEDKLIEK